MSRPRLRAVVLAAGHGTRLRPLTAELPKALLPILGRPLLAGTLERLAAAGVEAAAINLHHRGDSIAAALGERFDGMPLHYSREEPILGTLGALHPLRDFLAPADLVLLVNGDSLCRWPFAELIERHRETRPWATLLLSATADVDTFGGVGIDEAGWIVAFPEGRRGAARPPTPAHPWASLLPGRAEASSTPTSDPPAEATVAVRRVFGGAHVFAPSLALEAPATFSDIIRDLYRPGIAAGRRLQSLSTAAPWHDLGTPGRYLDAVLDWAELVAVGSWIHPAARVDPSATLERAVIEADVTVEGGVHGRELLVLGGARLGRSSRLERVVVGPGVEIAAGAAIANGLVTPRAWGTVAGSREEGALVITPLEPPRSTASAAHRRRDAGSGMPSGLDPELS